MFKLVYNGQEDEKSVVYCDNFREVMETVSGLDIFNNLSIWNCDSIEIFKNIDGKWYTVHKLTNTITREYMLGY